MYKKYANDFYADFYDQTTDDTDYAPRDADTSDERHSRTYVSRTHDMELLNAKFNPRPSRPTGNAKARSQTITNVYKSKKGRHGTFVKKLNNAIRMNTVGDDSSVDYMYREQTTRLGGTLDFTQRTSHRQPLDSLTYNFMQERGLDSLTMGTVLLTEGSEPREYGIYDRLRPLINSDVIGHSVSHIQSENEEISEHIKRLSYKLLKMEKNCGFGLSESMQSQQLGSTISYHVRPHILQEEMDYGDQEYEAVMGEYNYLANRLKQLRDPMYRKELEDKRLRVVEETNMIKKLIKNTMKRADIEEKDLQAIKEGKKYPEILQEVNLKQTEMMKIHKKLDVLRKKNREFEREKDIKEEREKELVEKYESLQYMDDYYRGASLDRTQRKTRRSEEETVQKRAGSVNRDSTGYAKQIEDTKSKYMRQQVLSEIESLSLQNMQEKEHLNKLEAIAKEQRQMIYAMMEREKITGFDWCKDIVEKEMKEPQKPKISKEFLTPPKADVAEKKTFALQILEEEPIDDREEEDSEDMAMKSQSSDSMSKSSGRSSIRIRKVDMKTVQKDEVIIVKEKESKAVVKILPRMEEKVTAQIVQKRVETVDMGTSYDEKRETPVKEIILSKKNTMSPKSVSEEMKVSEVYTESQRGRQSPKKILILQESPLSIQCPSELQSVKSMSQKESPRSEKSKQDNREEEFPVELKLVEKGGHHEIAQVVSLGESMVIVDAAIQPKERVMKVEPVKKVVPVVVQVMKQEEVIQPQENIAVKETVPVVESDIKEEVLEEKVVVIPAVEENVLQAVENESEALEVNAENTPEIVTKPVLKPILSRKSTNRQLRMPSIPELLKENSTEKDPTPQKSEPIEAVNQFETKEGTPKSDVPAISEVSVHEEAEKIEETQTEQEHIELIEEEKPKEAEKVMETQTEQIVEEEESKEPKELVLPECALKTRKSLFTKDDEVEQQVPVEEEVQKETQAEEKVEAEKSSPIKPAEKPAEKPVVKLGPVGRMNIIRRGNNEATPKNSDKKKEEIKPKAGTKQFVMPARRLVISKPAKRSIGVGKQEGVVASKGNSEAASEAFSEMSSSEYFVSEAGSGLLQESVVVMRPAKVSIAVGTDDVYAGTGKLVENLMFGKEKDVRELALDFERKMREKTMTMTMQKKIKKETVMVEKGTEAMLYGY